MSTATRRIRKATLTEIKEGEEWEWPDPGNLEDDLDHSDDEVEIDSQEFTTEEIFENFDEAVQDWKNNLELIVSDALKKLKKNGREKKLMVKYIPGETNSKKDELINPVKEEIYTHWKREMKQTIKVTQKRLNKLNYDKLGEIANLGFKSKYNGKTYNKNKVEKLNNKDSTTEMRALFKDMENLYAAYSDKLSNKIPIYDIAGIEKARNSGFSWFKPVCTLCNMMIEYPIKKAIKYHEKDEDILDMLKDFTMDYKPKANMHQNFIDITKAKEKKLTKNLTKSSRRGSNSTQRMKERRERNKYVLKEIEIDGEKRCFLIKKKEKVHEDAADIFNDWKNNLMKKRQRKPRTRKLSHRAQRKQMIKSSLSGPPTEPKTYAEALKQNLKIVEHPAVEDIFPSFIYLVNRLAKTEAQQSSEDICDIFYHFRHNFHIPTTMAEDLDIMDTTSCLPGFKPMNPTLDCAEPTIKTIPKAKKSVSLPTKLAVRKLMKPSKNLTKEIVMKKEFVTNLKAFKKQEKQRQEDVCDASPAQPKQIVQQKKVKVEYIQEGLFQDWIHNLEEPKVQRSPTPRPVKSANRQLSSKQANKTYKKVLLNLDYSKENYFTEWMHNLTEAETVQNVQAAVTGTVSPKSKSPAMTPNVGRKGSTKKPKEPLRECDMNDEVFENFKEGRRDDFNKVAKIKDKKRTQAERRSTGKRIK